MQFKEVLFTLVSVPEQTKLKSDSSVLNSAKVFQRTKTDIFLNQSYIGMFSTIILYIQKQNICYKRFNTANKHKIDYSRCQFDTLTINGISESVTDSY